jgi:hypothetical protein
MSHPTGLFFLDPSKVSPQKTDETNPKYVRADCGEGLVAFTGTDRCVRLQVMHAQKPKLVIRGQHRRRPCSLGRLPSAGFDDWLLGLRKLARKCLLGTDCESVFGPVICVDSPSPL